MITKKDVALTYKIFQFYHRINFIPLNFDSNTFLAAKPHSIVRFRLWQLNFLLTTVYYIYVNVQLFCSLVFPDNFVLLHFPIHFSFSAYSVAAFFTAYVAFISKDLSTLVIANVIRDLFEDNRDRKSVLKRAWKTWSLLDILIVSVVPSLWTYLPMLYTLLALTPDRSQLLFPLLSDTLPRSLTIIISLAVDVYCVGFLNAIFSVSAFLQFCFFRKMVGQLDKDLLSANSTANLGDIASALKRVQILVTIFNVSHSTIIFSCKILCMSLAIIMPAYGIICFHKDSPILGAYSLLIGANSGVGYTICYDKAFRIPFKVELLKAKLMNASWGAKLLAFRQSFAYRKIADKMELRAIMRSVPTLGIKVGQFNLMERQSTPLFVHFVIAQIASLLVALRQ